MADIPVPVTGAPRPPRAAHRPVVVVVAAAAMGIVAVLAIAGGLVWVASCLVLGYALTMLGSPMGPALLLPVGLGLGVSASGLLSAYLARRLLAGDHRARWASLAVALLLGLLAAGQAWGLTRAGATTWIWPALTIGCGIVALGLWRAGPWFEPGAVRTTPWPMRHSRLAGPVAAIVAAIAVIVVIAQSPQVAGDGRPLGYLRSLPERELAFPGGQLTGERQTGQDGGFGFGGPATIERRFEVQAAIADITAWYDAELRSRGWVRDDRSQASWDDPRIPRWRRDFATIEVRDGGTTGSGRPVVLVVTVAERFGYDYTTLDALKALPAARLAYPGSVVRSSAGMPRQTGEDVIFAANFRREFETEAAIEELTRNLDRELQSQGWVRVVQDRNPIGENWTKDGLRLRLTAHRPEPTTPTGVTTYQLKITEVLDPDEMPGFPWDG